jgi:1-acyl-sn-glycerol-3-phosphate acyltransferase
VATILNELQLDALTEMVNIGVNRAAAGLREMVGEQVHLSVPKVSLVSRDKAIATLGDSETANLVGIHQVFEGDVTGRALLIFPEGGNWTPKRHERAVRYLLRTGQYERAKEAQEEEHVLPPRPGGVVAALSARPDLDVVVLVHAGLDQLVSPIDIWDAIPVLHQPMSIHWWVASAGTVPADHREILTWVDDIWGEVDAWVEAELKDVTPIPPSPTP